MTEDGGGLELNIFSSPAAPQPIRKKKRSSGKAWDKKKKTRPLPLDSIHDGAAQLGKTAQPPASGSEDGVDARHRETRQSPQTESSGSTTVGTVKPHQQHEKDERSNDRQRLATTGRAAGSHSTITAGAVGSAGTASGGRKSELSSTAAKKSSHPDGNNNGSHKSAASSIDKEPSYERRRVLEMAGRAPAVTLQGSPDDGATATAKRTNNKMTAAGSTNAEDKKKSAKKRKRKSEPVVANGVIDFTVGNTDHDKPQSNKNVRRAASAAAAVAKATAKMQEAGVHKWWDDDDDDHVSTLAASKVAKPPPAAAGRWRGQWGGTVVDAPEEDKDGGLPSKVHPNSVRTKAVDMGAEASNAMGILTALLGPSDGGSGGGTEPRLKNGGKSKKRAREEGPPVISEADRETVASPIGRDGDDIPIGGSVPPFPGVAKGGKEATASGRALTAEPVQQQGTRDARTTSTAAVASNGDGDGPGTTATREPSDGLDDGGFCDDQTTAGTGVITRKTRGKHERDGDAAHSTAPLPEHHARPRELSRRAAATPLASARSGHVMAAGPGATFAALGLPPKMVAHLVEPKGESGGGGMGLVGPTVCQLAAIPTLAAGHNTVVKSETGSGKTLTYLLPLLCDLAAREPRVERENGTLAIVLAPTRELCAQILEVVLTA